MRESWKSRFGLVLAAAGNAVGIGNLLRFPGQAANNGGGAFILPYLISLVLFGVPMMWVAWTIGRLGGRHGHGTTPGIFDKLTRWRGGKYLGALGVAIPFAFCIFYTYLEAWCLAYAWFSFRGTYAGAHLPTFLREFQGVLPTANYFSSVNVAFVFLLITLALNVWVLYRGVAAGIELLAKIAMPLLIVFCVLLCVRIFTMPDAKGSVTDGLGFIWNPNFSALASPKVWLAAAGQIFFTLSLGLGALECYASYVRSDDDIAVTGLTTAATNEFVEIILGSMIAIPAAAVFFGAGAIPQIASTGTFDIGMVSMPQILAGSPIFGTIWFLLLFFAAFTSSVGVCQPVMAFFQDEAKLSRGAAAAIVGLFWLLASVPIVFFYKYGILDELDFWAGTLGLVVFSAIEAILFAWVFGIGKGWQELHRGALMRVPAVFRFMMKYVTPTALILLLGGWVYSDVIVGDALSIRPRMNIGVMEAARYPGEFVSGDGDAGAKRQVAALKAPLLDAVAEAGRDATAWVTVSLDARGTPTVLRVEGDPLFERALGIEQVDQMLRVDRYRYLENGETAPTRVVLVMQVLYTAPYIWLGRGMLIGLLLFFVVMVRVLWKRRAEDASRAGAPEPAGPASEAT
ncbi:MAG: hypothetical protein OZ928_10750 [Polyangiaceae bacterium]|nr:hypothetical protein [Polyangiaceae bacterium]